QYFVLRHVGKNLVWLPAAGAAMLVVLAIAIAPKPAATGAPSAGKRITFADVQPLIKARCTVCHAEEPPLAGFVQPPGGVMFDTAEQVKAAAQRIHQQTIATQAMQIGNLT